MRLGWLVPSWHSMVPEWTFLRGTPWLEMRRSFVAVFLSHSQFLPPFSQLYISSFLSVFLCHRCAHGCRKHPSRGSSTERTSSFLASPAVPALCPSHGCQLSSFAATLTSQPFSSLLFSFFHHISQLIPLPLSHDTAISLLLSWKICLISSACSPSCFSLL